jgi:hypothetical protein
MLVLGGRSKLYTSDYGFYLCICMKFTTWIHKLDSVDMEIKGHSTEVLSTKLSYNHIFNW